MRIDVLTLFPDMFSAYLDESIIGRALAGGLLSVHLHNIRGYAAGKHRVTDEPPYGGGGGMVLKPEPLFLAAEAATTEGQRHLGQDAQPRVLLMSPQGRLLTQALAAELASQPWLILLCGRYEGVDERVREYLVDEEISIGDYVLTGGELPALVVIDAVTRLLPGALGAEGAAATDSHATGLLEGPHYTRPDVYRGWQVPDVLRSGHGGRIARWRREAALRRTWEKRPDLLLSAHLSEEDKHFLLTLARESIEAADHGA